MSDWKLLFLFQTEFTFVFGKEMHRKCLRPAIEARRQFVGCYQITMCKFPARGCDTHSGFSLSQKMYENVNADGWNVSSGAGSSTNVLLVRFCWFTETNAAFVPVTVCPEARCVTWLNLHLCSVEDDVGKISPTFWSFKCLSGFPGLFFSHLCFYKCWRSFFTRCQKENLVWGIKTTF